MPRIYLSMGSEGNVTPKSTSSGSAASDEPVFLHGDLDLSILEAKSLPNMDLITESMRKCCNMCGHGRFPFKKTRGLSGRHSMITSNPYVSVCLSGATVAQTRVISNCENPFWDEHFCVPVAHSVVNLEFHVKDNDILGAELIGVVQIPVEKILCGNEVDDWFPIAGSYGKNLKPFPQLHVSMQYKPIGQIPLYKDGVGAGPDYQGVPKTYFPLRKEGNLTLYQDAHVPPGMLPEIALDGGKTFRHGQCWEEICHAVLEARHLIYIIGWSVFHPVKLVREPTKPLPSGGELSFGELLKHKSQEGVRVLLLIWDDKTSHDNLFIKTVIS